MKSCKQCKDCGKTVNLKTKPYRGTVTLCGDCASRAAVIVSGLLRK